MIPKILHFIWFGNCELPKAVIDSWHKYNPSYEIKIWREEDIEKFGLENKKHWDSSGFRYNQKSDIARYEILKKYGGFYIDMDICCLSKIPKYMEECDEYFCFEKRGVVCNSFIGIKPNSKIMSSLISDISKNYDYKKTIWKCTGPLLFTKHVKFNIERSDGERKILLEDPSTLNLISGWSKKLLLHPDEFIKFLNSEPKIINPSHNKDLQYKWTNDYILGVHIWLGGRSELYKNLSENLKNLNKNFSEYLSFIEKNKNYQKKFDITKYRLK